MLFQANDRLFKSELGKIVELDIWDSARGQSYSLLKDCRQLLQQEMRVLSIHKATLERYHQQLDEIRKSAQSWQREKAGREEAAEAHVEECVRCKELILDCIVICCISVVQGTTCVSVAQISL